MNTQARFAFVLMPLVAASVVVSSATLRPQAPSTAQDIVARSVAAHGGDRLTNWRTLAIAGTVEMEDGITYRAAYRLLAKLPGKLRVDQDMTAGGGRLFYEYFLSDGVAWSRRNLIPGRADVKRLERWLNQCFGIAYYAQHARTLALQPDGAVEWKEPAEQGSSKLKVVDTTPAFVVRATVEATDTDLYIDKKRFYLLQEVAPDGRRVFRDFKDFGGVVLPTRINEITTNRQGDVLTPYTYQTVRFNQPIEDWRFEEDKPVRRQPPPHP
jgi:hypothetical protein